MHHYLREPDMVHIMVHNNMCIYIQKHNMNHSNMHKNTMRERLQYNIITF